MVCTRSTMSFSHKEEWDTVLCIETGGSGGQQAKWSKTKTHTAVFSRAERIHSIRRLWWLGLAMCGERGRASTKGGESSQCTLQTFMEILHRTLLRYIVNACFQTIELDFGVFFLLWFFFSFIFLLEDKFSFKEDIFNWLLLFDSPCICRMDPDASLSPIIHPVPRCHQGLLRFTAVLDPHASTLSWCCSGMRSLCWSKEICALTSTSQLPSPRSLA